MSVVRELPLRGRFIAFHLEQEDLWEVRVIDQAGKFSRFVGESLQYLSYTAACERIAILESSGVGVFDPTASVI
jgi:hypothetical protein